MRVAGLLMVLALLSTPALGQGVFSSHLPVVLIETGGATIPNEPKITARMRVVDNGPGQVNRVTDPPNGYDGFVGIEVRGSSTQMFPKKQYAVETREADGSNRNVALLGLPEENDWVLNAPYSDKSLLRNVLAYGTARRMGRYASRARFCEVVLNGRYQGVYVLFEKIKRDRARVDVAALDPDDVSGDALTGGYLLKVDKWDGSGNEGWPSKVRPPARPDRDVMYQYHDPEPAELTPEQKAYIRGAVGAFEDVMRGPAFADPVEGYPKYLDVDAFVDYLILNELSRNVDGYRLSAFFYKDRDSRDGRFVMGPAWDYNLAFGNADYYDGSATAGWQVHFAAAGDDFQVPFWWDRLLQDSTFRLAVAERWRVLRRGVLHTDSLHAAIDAGVAALGEAVGRNFERWPVLSTYVWPNNFVGGTYAREITYLKDWVRARAAWIDANVEVLRPLGGETVPDVRTGGLAVFDLHPNPAGASLAFTLAVGARQAVRVEVYDAAGQRRAVLADAVFDVAEHPLRFGLGGLPAGAYFLRAAGASRSVTAPFVVVR